VLLETLRNELLPQVQKPGQYLGLEWGAHRKDWDSSKSRMAIIYPDLYELGMSNFGIKILYNIVNNHPDYLCDRAYGVMPDMEELLEERNLPLWGWESYKPLSEFDFLGFSLGYELCYPNVFTILKLPKIPFLSKDRDHSDPIIFAGGPAAFNPEPMADYIDFFIIGDGEELVVEVQDSMLETKRKFLEENPEILASMREILSLRAPTSLRSSGQAPRCNLPANEIATSPSAPRNDSVDDDYILKSLKNFPLEKNKSLELREQILFDLSQKRGVYVPRFYEPDPEKNYMPVPRHPDTERSEVEGSSGSVKASALDSSPTAQNDTTPFPVYKRITQYLDDTNNPVTGPVPVIGTVQDKQILEIRRGCDRGCRFCQVGYTYLPVRERSPEDLYRLSSESIKKTGYEDQTLLSLSASDYTCLTEAARAINNEHAAVGIGISMPSQRADRFNVDLASELSQVRKSGMTFAPEAGTEKMRKIINKGLSQEEIFRAIKGSYQEGWSTIKLYFMIGLPFEDDSDLDGILDILSWTINMSRELRREDNKKYNKPIKINCTISTFIPKSFTAFQWFSQCSEEEFHRKQRYLKNGIRERKLNSSVKINYTEPELALIESVLSRGDRRWGVVIQEIWNSGSRYDSWSENFKIERWQKAAEKFGLDLHEEATHHREPGSKQPWDVLSIGFTDTFLLDEWNQAVNVAETIPCTENKCHACGVCFNLDVKNIVAENLSSANPFVTEIDKEKRKESCANFMDKVMAGESELKTQAEIIKVKKNSLLREDEKCNSNVRSRECDKNNEPVVIVRDTKSAQRLRLKISKLGDLKFISHLDFQRLFERALRRTGLRVVHSTGFNQRMKVTWLTAVPLFIESEGEYLELDLAIRYDNLENLREIFNNELPIQARILDVKEIDPGEKLSNQSLIEAVYLAELIQVQNSKDNAKQESITALKTENVTLDQALVGNFLDKESILIKKFSKGREKQKDLRPEIKEVKLIDPSTIELNLLKTQRADEVLTALIPGSTWKVKKLSQVLA